MTDRHYVGTDFDLKDLVDRHALDETRTALETLLTAPRPGNRLSATIAPNGNPNSPASMVADSVTISDSRRIAYSAGSPDRISDRALVASKARHPR